MKFKLFLYSIIFVCFPIFLYAQVDLTPTDEQAKNVIGILQYLLPILFLAISGLYWQQMKIHSDQINEMKAGSAERAERLKKLELQQTEEHDSVLKILILTEQTLQKALIAISDNQKAIEEITDFFKNQKQ